MFKKKILLTVALLSTLSVATLTSCNYQVIDTTYSYNYAIIDLHNGTVVEGPIKSWRDYEEGEQLQITMEDGTIYLTNSYNCTLIRKK